MPIVTSVKMWTWAESQTEALARFRDGQCRDDRAQARRAFERGNCREFCVFDRIVVWEASELEGVSIPVVCCGCGRDVPPEMIPLIRDKAESCVVGEGRGGAEVDGWWVSVGEYSVHCPSCWTGVPTGL